MYNKVRCLKYLTLDWARPDVRHFPGTCGHTWEPAVAALPGYVAEATDGAEASRTAASVALPKMIWYSRTAE
ncbi:hypothetical protein E2562_011024 [Oryza meyeriana var. granulata]|uniref:Uncharacterized protein n=1 Tax=Oryza meyeriana var. granulata TaxID=110450 RepID=A0A6G1EW87_9ORYZ|nr:hypothetical protein E2562_011024 [Oryza meyeriana var. granulata]